MPWKKPISGIVWTDARRAELLALKAQGLSYREIGDRLGVTKHAISGEIARMARVAAGMPRYDTRTTKWRMPPQRQTPPPPRQKQPSPQPLPRGARTLPLLPSEIAALERKNHAERP